MREILFRGKRLSDGEWVTGYYIQPTYHWHKRGIHKDWIACGAVSNGGWLNLLQKYAVIPETVGQYTGLTDKNGKKIFEGDIVRVDDDVKETFPQVEDGDVRFARGGFFVGSYGDILRSLDVIADFKGVLRGEVIGNIHDNPELLTKEE